MLNVEGRPDVDTGVEQFFDVLPALGVARAVGVRMRQLIDEHELRPPSDRGVEIEFAEGHTAIPHFTGCNSLPVLEAMFRFSRRPCGSTYPTKQDRRLNEEQT